MADAAFDLGRHVTLVRDATAAFSKEAMRAAHDFKARSFVHALVTAAALLDAFGRVSAAPATGEDHVRRA